MIKIFKNIGRKSNTYVRFWMCTSSLSSDRVRGAVSRVDPLPWCSGLELAATLYDCGVNDDPTSFESESSKIIKNIISYSKK